MGGTSESTVHWDPTEMSLFQVEIKPSERQSGAGKTKIKFTLSHPQRWIVDRQTWMPPIFFFFFFFFCEGDRINSKLVYAVPKINLIQKGSGGQRHHLPCPLRQIIAKIVSTLCTQELKLETLTIQYSKGFCCPFPRIVLLSHHGPSAEEDNSWQVETSPWRPHGLDFCVKDAMV